MAEPSDNSTDSEGKATGGKSLRDRASRAARALVDSTATALRQAFGRVTGKAGDDDTPGGGMPDSQQQARLAEIARESAPIIWLLGKTGSGKTSAIAALTGVAHGEIGTGYQPCTRTASLYDFPSDTPLIRFLDTRGLDEPGYDPSEDLEWHQSQAHLIMVVMRAGDPAQDHVVKAVAAARKAQPRWPVVVLHSALHDLYPANADHPPDYPYSGGDEDLANPAIPATLRNAIAHQRQLFAKLKGEPPLFVAVDFTRAVDGFTPAHFGREALIDALLRTAPEALRLLVQIRLRDESGSGDEESRRLNTRILYWAAAASAVGAAPVVGLATVPAAQLAMLASLGRSHGIEWNRQELSALLGMLGVAIVASQGGLLALRQLAKLGAWLIPLAAAKDYAVTYALGRAACVYLEARRDHGAADADQVKAVFVSSLKEAFSGSGEPPR